MEVESALDCLGVRSFRGEQTSAVAALLGGKDTLYVISTGTGKFLVYQVAALCTDGVTIIVSPLIGLLREQVCKLTDSKVGVIEAFGEVLRAYNDAECSHTTIIYSTPEQVRRASPLGRWLDREQRCVKRIVVDEAHLVCDWDTFRCGMYVIQMRMLYQQENSMIRNDSYRAGVVVSDSSVIQVVLSRRITNR